VKNIRNTKHIYLLLHNANDVMHSGHVCRMNKRLINDSCVWSTWNWSSR